MSSPQHQPQYQPQFPSSHPQQPPHQQYQQPAQAVASPPPYPQPAAAGPGGPPVPPPPAAGRSKRPKVLLAIVVVLVLLAGAVGAGVLLLGGDDRPAMATHPDLTELSFPDADALSYEEGEDAHCAAVEELLAPRGYALFNTEGGNGISCMLGTPGTSSLEDGSTSISLQVALTRGGEAGSQYERYLDTTVEGTENLAEDTSFTFSELYEFPVGEEGFLSQNEWTGGPSGSATAGFRSGDDTFYVHLSGSVLRHDEDTPNELLTMDVTRQELVDVVKALGGDDSAGEPLITPVEMATYEGLPELDAPGLAEGASAEERCAVVADVAAELGSDPDSVNSADGTVPTTVCSYQRSLETEDYGANGMPMWRIEVTEDAYGSAPENLIPTEELGRDLGDIMSEPEDPFMEGDVITLGELYELPVGESGYMIYSHSVGEHSYGSSTQLRAGYVLDNGAYMQFRVTGGEYGDDGFEGYSEEALVEVFMDLLTAMDG
ncbi:hypothetical protein ACTWP5_19210 [Streptomyces sp. 4N509B]|uniref:hypothetical protein n=1 Tax=Streptomyces sp. 4N509B TaxID=3457413 RepID=UPI003FD1AF1F